MARFRLESLKSCHAIKLVLHKHRGCLHCMRQVWRHHNLRLAYMKQDWHCKVFVFAYRPRDVTSVRLVVVHVTKLLEWLRFSSSLILLDTSWYWLMGLMLIAWNIWKPSRPCESLLCFGCGLPRFDWSRITWRRWDLSLIRRRPLDWRLKTKMVDVLVLTFEIKEKWNIARAWHHVIVQVSMFWKVLFVAFLGQTF